jgi:hypothetical protein
VKAHRSRIPGEQAEGCGQEILPSEKRQYMISEVP